MCLTITAHQPHGKRTLIAVQPHATEPYHWLVTVDTGAGDVLYRIVDTVSDGYTVEKVGGNGETYRVYLGDRGASCTCADSRHRRRECRHVAACREVAKRW